MESSAESSTPEDSRFATGKRASISALSWTSDSTNGSQDGSEGNQRLHQCLAIYRTPTRSIHTCCDDPNPSVPIDLFNCANAECQVCLNLSWVYFTEHNPEYHQGLRVPRVGGELCRSISTTLYWLEASRTSCNSCSMILAAIEMAWAWTEERALASFEQLVARRVEVTIDLRIGFTVLIKIDEFGSSHFEAEIYKDIGKIS